MIVVEDLRSRVTKAVDRLVRIAYRKEDVLATYQANQIGLLLIDVLEFVEHDLAKLCLNAIAHFVIAAEQIDGTALKVVEIEVSPGGFCFGVQFVEAGENVEDDAAKAGGAAVYSRGGENREHTFLEVLDFRYAAFVGRERSDKFRNLQVLRPLEQLIPQDPERGSKSLPLRHDSAQLGRSFARVDRLARVGHGAHFGDGPAGGADAVVCVFQITREIGLLQRGD